MIQYGDDDETAPRYEQPFAVRYSAQSFAVQSRMNIIFSSHTKHVCATIIKDRSSASFINLMMRRTG